MAVIIKIELMNKMLLKFSAFPFKKYTSLVVLLKEDSFKLIIILKSVRCGTTRLENITL